jgi:putative glutamine amidotransferase
MKRIAVTQRVEEFYDGAERRDCLDQSWTRILVEIGFMPIPMGNQIDDVGQFIDSLQIEGILLTGGNDIGELPAATNNAPERDALERKLIDLSIERGIPIFGVCRGLQILSMYYGTKVEPVSGHTRTRHSVNIHENDVLVIEDRKDVNSYHNFGVYKDELAEDLCPVAIADDGTVEAFAHRRYRHAAIMWHPERAPYSKADHELIRKFFTFEEEN